MKSIKWGFAVFVIVFCGLFIAGHLETDGKTTQMILWDEPAKVSTIDTKVDVVPPAVGQTVTTPHRRPLFPRIHKLFHPRQRD